MKKRYTSIEIGGALRKRAHVDAVKAISGHVLATWLKRLTAAGEGLAKKQRDHLYAEIMVTLHTIPIEYVACGRDVGRTGLIMNSKFQRLVDSFSPVESFDVCKENC